MSAQPTKQEMLEHRADLLRGRLLHTVDALDRRRKTAVQAGRALKARALPVLAAVGTGIVLVSATTAYVVHRLHVRRARVAPDWKLALIHALTPRPPRPSAWAEAGRKALSSVATLCAARAGRYLLDRWLDRGPVLPPASHSDSVPIARTGAD